MRFSTKLVTAILVASSHSLALAQTNVGQLLDRGAVRLSAADFKQQIVGRFLVGPARGGGGVSNTITTEQEVVYLEGGSIRGSGQVSNIGGTAGFAFVIDGTWTTDDHDRICQAVRSGSLVLAPRCQYWFKVSDKYYFADSDSDRSALITVRTVKKP